MPSRIKVVSDIEYNTLPSPATMQQQQKVVAKAGGKISTTTTSAATKKNDLGAPQTAMNAAAAMGMEKPAQLPPPPVVNHANNGNNSISSSSNGKKMEYRTKSPNGSSSQNQKTLPTTTKSPSGKEEEKKQAKKKKSGGSGSVAARALAALNDTSDDNDDDDEDEVQCIEMNTGGDHSAAATSEEQPLASSSSSKLPSGSSASKPTLSDTASDNNNENETNMTELRRQIEEEVQQQMMNNHTNVADDVADDSLDNNNVVDRTVIDVDSSNDDSDEEMGDNDVLSSSTTTSKKKTGLDQSKEAAITVPNGPTHSRESVALAVATAAALTAQSISSTDASKGATAEQNLINAVAATAISRDAVALAAALTNQSKSSTDNASKGATAEQNLMEAAATMAAPSKTIFELKLSDNDLIKYNNLKKRLEFELTKEGEQDGKEINRLRSNIRYWEQKKNNKTTTTSEQQNLMEAATTARMAAPYYEAVAAGASNKKMFCKKRKFVNTLAGQPKYKAVASTTNLIEAVAATTAIAPSETTFAVASKKRPPPKRKFVNTLAGQPKQQPPNNMNFVNDGRADIMKKAFALAGQPAAPAVATNGDVAFNVGPLSEEYIQNMVLPEKHTRNLIFSLKGLSMTLASEKAGLGGPFGILTTANIMKIARSVPTLVTNLHTCGLSSYHVQTYGQRIISSIAEFIQKEKLQNYLQFRRFMAPSSISPKNPPQQQQHQQQQNRNNARGANSGISNQPIIERFSEYRIDNATTISQLEAMRRRLMTLLERTEERLKEKRLADAMSLYGEENLEQLSTDELIERLTKIVDKTTDETEECDMAGSDNNTGKRKCDETMADGDNNNKRQCLSITCPLCLDVITPPSSVVGTCQICDDTDICHQCYSSCTSCCRSTCADCLMVCDSCGSHYHCTDCMIFGNGKCRYCRPNKVLPPPMNNKPLMLPRRTVGNQQQQQQQNQVTNKKKPAGNNHAMSALSRMNAQLGPYPTNYPPPPTSHLAITDASAATASVEQLQQIYTKSAATTSSATARSNAGLPPSATNAGSAPSARSTAAASLPANATNQSIVAQKPRLVANAESAPSTTTTNNATKTAVTQQPLYSFHRFVITETAENNTIGLNFALDKKTKRVRVSNVHADSIAMKLGLKVDDEILAPQSSEGQSINVYALFLQAAKFRPLSLCFEVNRQVVAQDAMVQPNQCFHRFTITKPGKLGLTLQHGNGKKTDDKATVSHVAHVSKVTPGSISDIYGIQDGDIIYKASINGTSIADFQALVGHAKAGSRPIVLEIVRNIGSPRKAICAKANSSDNPFTITFPSQEIDSNKKDVPSKEIEANEKDASQEIEANKKNDAAMGEVILLDDEDDSSESDQSSINEPYQVMANEDAWRLLMQHSFTLSARGDYCLPDEENRPGKGSSAVEGINYFCSLEDLRKHLCAYGIPGGKKNLEEDTCVDMDRWVRYANVVGLGDAVEIDPNDVEEIGWKEAWSMLRKLGMKYTNGDYCCPNSVPSKPDFRFERQQDFYVHLARFGIPIVEGIRANEVLNKENRLSLDLHIANTEVDSFIRIDPKSEEANEITPRKTRSGHSSTTLKPEVVNLDSAEESVDGEEEKKKNSSSKEDDKIWACDYCQKLFGTFDLAAKHEKICPKCSGDEEEKKVGDASSVNSRFSDISDNRR